MESQELKMLVFLNKYKNNEDNFLNSILENFKSFDHADDLINNLNLKGYTYVKATKKEINLGNTDVLLTDKGIKYLKGNKIIRWFIENSNNAIICANLVTLFTFGMGLIINGLINMDKIIFNFYKYIKFW